MNLSILTGLNLTLDALNQFLFGTFLMVIFTAKHSSIKDISIKLRGSFVKILRVKIGFSVEAITSCYAVTKPFISKNFSSLLSFSE